MLTQIGPLTSAWHIKETQAELNSLNTYEMTRDAGKGALRQVAQQEEAIWNLNVILGLF